MQAISSTKQLRIIALLVWVLPFLGDLTAPAWAHCDTLDGPVIQDARTALEQEDVTPVLKWIAPVDESEVNEAFTQAIVVRRLGGEARKLADQWFFETLVRLHREGEGFPYTGLKPAGTPISPAIQAADAALDTGSVEELAGELSQAVNTGVRSRFEHVIEAQAHEKDNVPAGRDFVAAYVEFTHYVEALEATASGHSFPHEAGTVEDH